MRLTGGKLSRNERWSGVVRLKDHLLVPKGITLTIEPGTVVFFRHHRGYRNPEKRLVLRVEGKLVAQGRPERMIRFTSDAVDPRNGDWSMVKLVSAAGSQISHAIFEHGQHGLNIWNTDLRLSHLVVRFNNWEGIYIESYSKVQIESSRIYANGYNCLAMEQYNEVQVRGSYLANCGTAAVHVDASRASVQDSLIEGCQEGVSLDDDAQAVLSNNRFVGQRHAAISCGQGTNVLTVRANAFDGILPEKQVACPDGQVDRRGSDLDRTPRFRSGVAEGMGPYLDYIPGDPVLDPYPYVYPDADETRRVEKKVGGGLGLAWSCAWDGQDLWTATLAGEIYRLDPRTGEVKSRLRAPGPQPWGMTFDGRLLWVNDFARRELSGLDPLTGQVRRTLASPDPAGGCKGLAFDGKHLFALGWSTHELYELSETGKVVSRVESPSHEIGGGVRLWVAGGLTWDGEAFWAPSDRLVRFNRKGEILGWIYGTSERVWDLCWDGKALWATQRANENWHDYPRLFRIKVLSLKRF